MISVTVLVENTARGAGVLGEHGLAWWIDTGCHRVLFDTGQGLALQHNALALGVDLARADAVVLSHGHYDHVGGLESALTVMPRAAIYMHPRAIEAKFSGSGGGATGRSVSQAFVEQERFRAPGRAVVQSVEPREVVPGVWMTGEIPRTNDFEDTGGRFFLDAALRHVDPLLDDQAVFFTCEEGVVVVLGCAHAGVINTLAYVSRLTGRDRIHAVLGGMHLEHASPRRMAQTFVGFRQYHVRRIGPLHCTGSRATIAFFNSFGDRCESAAAGTRFTFKGEAQCRGTISREAPAWRSPADQSTSVPSGASPYPRRTSPPIDSHRGHAVG